MAKKVIKPIMHATVGLQPVFNFSLRSKYIFLALVGFVFYANTLFNKYAFDDGAVILNNAFVQMGFKGIPKILTNDAWSSYYGYIEGDPSSKQLSGGRYRPLSLVIFAVEQQFLGNSDLLPLFRHLVNVLAYIACILAIFFFFEKKLLKNIPEGSDMAFLSSFLFAIHPLHTEVVANIKSLDEILSLLFIMLTFIFSLSYLEGRKIKYLVMAIGSFFLALLSKEYAITMLFFIPLLFYLLEDKKFSGRRILNDSLPYYSVFIIYLIIRYAAVGFYHSSLQNASTLADPYFYATTIQKFATKWFVLLKYMGLLFFPYPMSYDYSYKQIPYHYLTDITVILSILMYMGILYRGVILIRKKSVFSFAVFFFLINIFMISNFVIDIGAAMGERLVFHSSLGFVLILSYFLVNIFSIKELKQNELFTLFTRKLIFWKKIPVQTKRNIFWGLMSLISVMCLGETVMRNTQWKDDPTLYIHDIRAVPNSCLANNNAGWSYLVYSENQEITVAQTKSYLDSARKYLLRALYINQDFFTAYNSLGNVYLYMNMPDSARYCYKMVEKMNPSYPGLKTNYLLLSRFYLKEGINSGKDGKFPQSIISMKKALVIDSTNAAIWYNMAIAYYHTRQYDSEEYALMKTLQNNPDSIEATNAKIYMLDLVRMKNH